MNDMMDITEEVEAHIARLALNWFRECRELPVPPPSSTPAVAAFDALRMACDAWLEVEDVAAKARDSILGDEDEP